MRTMQFSLLTPQAERRDDERRGAPSTIPGAWRDSAISQLDAIAAASDRRAASRLRTQAVAFALVGLFAFATSAWWARRDEPIDSPRPAATPPAPVVGQRMPAPPPEPVQPSVVPPVQFPVATVPQQTTQARSADPASTAGVSSAAVPPNAKPRTAATAPPAAERRPRDSPGPRAPAASIPERSSAEPPPRPVPSPAPATPAARSNVAATAPAEPAPRPDVASVCGGSAFLAASFCQARECRKAEHHADPVCVRLREIEQARERAAADR